MIMLSVDSPWFEDVSRQVAVATNTPAEVTVTMKAGVGYDAPWMVFRGTVGAVEQAVADAFGWTGYDAREFTLADGVVAMGKTLAGKWAVADVLNARQLAGDGLPVDYGMREEDHEPGSPSSPTRPASSPVDGLSDAQKGVLGLVQSCPDEKGLEGLWRQYSTTINNSPVVLEAWKSRARELHERALAEKREG